MARAYEPNVKKYVDFCIESKKDEYIGFVVSPPYQLSGRPLPGAGGSAGVWFWVIDAEIDGTVIRSLPIATNNKDIFYADIGRAVTIKKIDGKFQVMGLAKIKKGHAKVVYLSFTDDIVKITGTAIVGYTYRYLTYEELGEIPGGYGIFPYGAIGKFDGEGNFVELMTR